MTVEEADASEPAYPQHFRAQFDIQGRAAQEPIPAILRLVSLTRQDDPPGPRRGPHGGPIYGSRDGVAIETKPDSPMDWCCWWGKQGITERTHDLVAFTPAASWEPDVG